LLSSYTPADARALAVMIAAFTDVSTIRFVHHLYYQRVQMK
ncbi:MAG: hypothetical protein RL126_536, partial [Actinomycetota bacterium]